jgi:hypothetical protein
MENIIHIVIPIISTFLGFLFGRFTKKLDRKTDRDRDTLNRLYEILPGDSVISYMQDQDFGSTFRSEVIFTLVKFLDLKRDANFFFLDESLNSRLEELFEATEIFIDRLGLNTSPISGLADGHRMDPIHTFTNKNEYFKVRNELNELAQNVCEKYNRLVKKARRKT